MTLTLGLVANVYNEARALPGWLETHAPFFDDIKVLHAGPQGAYSGDGTIELLEAWKIPVEFCRIDDGFGVVRTKALRMSKCDYVMLLDADERFYTNPRMMWCSGEPTQQHEVDRILYGYHFRDGNVPDWDEIDKLGNKIKVEHGVGYDQGQQLRELLEHHAINGIALDAVAFCRRHWHDFSFKRPTQYWHTDPDYQLRFVRNDPSIGFDSSTRMHERIVGANNIHHADTVRGPFFDHMHFVFKKQEQKQRAHDIAIYDAVHKGEKPPTPPEFDK